MLALMLALISGGENAARIEPAFDDQIREKTGHSGTTRRQHSFQQSVLITIGYPPIYIYVLYDQEQVEARRQGPTHQGTDRGHRARAGSRVRLC